MKRKLLFLICLLGCLNSYSGDRITNPGSSKVNFGIKGGFNSTMYFVNQFKIKDVTINDIQNNYKVGYFGTFFIRFNMKRHFLQPEFIYNVSKGEITFDKKGSQHPDIEPDYATITSTIRTVEVPLLYGYNFVKTGPYGMNFFLGPKVKYVWREKNKIEFSNFDQQGIGEKLFPFNISGIIGLGVSISNILFDFQYEIGMHNISKNVTYDNSEGISNIVFKRRANVLSFSLGVIF